MNQLSTQMQYVCNGLETSWQIVCPLSNLSSGGPCSGGYLLPSSAKFDKDPKLRIDEVELRSCRFCNHFGIRTAHGDTNAIFIRLDDPRDSGSDEWYWH